MKYSVLTLFPEFFEGLKQFSIIKRAIEDGYIDIETINIRDFSKNKHHKVDDYPYGGGPGMLMQVEPIRDAIASCKTDRSHVVYLSPQGRVLDQNKLKELATYDHLILLNGHYEGIDARALRYVDEEISIGDYVLTGGEIASMVLIDGTSRMINGVLSSEESYSNESHYNHLLEHPQYTRPQTFEGMEVPAVLLSGDHAKVAHYNKVEALRATLMKRPDLLSENKLTTEELKIIKSLKEESKRGGNHGHY
ncbi:tRNA (guanosine(37)-N1)-methyltransferase TrmD [Peptoniphilus equinus]|uniref:tRNA (guanine-N(1)-)-methyltransferase n=1 Tax=Peptoniphilus equinus TaxID=3016343 RepID=A0ABY7QV05_9FIRM|nr:tRNA (guanosine(37)-N1)-methyltransferase TrmD [Peptoniphilus equinus]WBW50629.1 tRNA (guanosine(37)-N1)-methyltransferase TrmD [Peptoniphilus equinus]